MLSAILKNKLAYFLLIFYILLVLWWVFIQVWGLRETEQNFAFGVVYALIALFGGINGVIISRHWGGWSSKVGMGIMLFSFGLFGEFFGQIVWSYYNIIAQVAVPYPSLADIGFFSIIPLYSWGMYSFAAASGAKFTFKTLKGKLYAFAIPLIMLIISYLLFVKDLSIDTNLLKTFFDFGYPLGEAIFISVALVTFSLANGILGGQMRSKVMFLIIALFAQYITEYTFIYTATAGSYYNAGVVDLMYATSFLLMSLGLMSFKHYES